MTSEQSLLTLDLATIAGGASITLTGAHYDRGVRTLSAQLDQAGRVGGCRFDRLRINIREQGYGNDNMMRVWVTRVVPGRSDWNFEALTDKARPIIHAEIEAAVVAYGFHRAWVAAFHPYDVAYSHAERMRTYAAWWDEVEELHVALAAGKLDVEPLPPRGWDDDRVRVDLVSNRELRPEWAEAAARLVLDGVQVGWLTDSGRVASMTSLRD